MMYIYFPYDLTIVPGLIIITITILEIRRSQKGNQPEDDNKGIWVMPVIIILAIALASYVHFFVSSKETQESITAVIRWLSLICSLIFLVLYLRKRIVQGKKVSAP